MGHPGRWQSLADSLLELREEGIEALVSLDEDGLDRDVLRREGFNYLHLAIDDFTPPTVPQADEFVEFVREQQRQGRAVVAHCYAGVGRTGTMLGCYLVAEGRSGEAAIAEVKRVSGAAVETGAQADFVRAYASHLQNRPTPQNNA